MSDTELAQRYESVRARITSACRSMERPQAITLIAVSKGQSADQIEALYRLGHRDFGENYVQELESKEKLLRSRDCIDLRWHFIGHLQSNKAKTVARIAHEVHSIESMRTAGELAKRWRESGREGRLPVFLAVNIDEEETKSGVAPLDAAAVCRQLAEFPELTLQGLMCIPDAERDSARAFLRLRHLETECRPHTHGQLSMGMSQDFELAARLGATHLRVGTALFGPRESHPNRR